MKDTTNKKLKKIDLTDRPPDITVINHNWDKIDTELQAGTDHSNNNAIHVTASDKTNWNSKANGSHNHSADNITGGTLGASRGGTGRAALTANYFLRGNGTGAVGLSSPATVRTDIGAAANPTVLYNNANGTSSNFTLSQTAANFAYMRIYFFYNDGAGRRCSSVDVTNPNSSYPCLSIFEHDASILYVKLARLFVSGTSVSFATNGHAWLTTNPTIGVNATTTPVKVTKVIAWN